jgi:hypothetical protein
MKHLREFAEMMATCPECGGVRSCRKECEYKTYYKDIGEENIYITIQQAREALWNDRLYAENNMKVG